MVSGGYEKHDEVKQDSYVGRLAEDREVVENDMHRVPSTWEILEYLTGFIQLGGEKWRTENDQYLNEHARRFHETLKVWQVSPYVMYREVL